MREAIDTTHIQRVAGLTGDRTALVATRPLPPPASRHLRKTYNLPHGVDLAALAALAALLEVCVEEPPRESSRLARV
jgi:hypothetical protein